MIPVVDILQHTRIYPAAAPRNDIAPTVHNPDYFTRTLTTNGSGGLQGVVGLWISVNPPSPHVFVAVCVCVCQFL